jgi:[NiFe] hydrogenase diaphorase moiety large subunit
MDIIKELKRQAVLGRSGSCFPAYLKWQQVKTAKGDKKYIICNASEGEPKNFKDKYILKNHPQYVVEGIKQALKAIPNSTAFIYLKKDYYKKFKRRLKKLAKGYPIKLVKKRGGYLAGEETVVCEVMEGKKAEPRIKPPYPSYYGLFGWPTLINNVETFYVAGKIGLKEYKGERFYTVSGDVKNAGVFELNSCSTVKQVLEQTGNYPDFDFFVQSGGGAMGEILLPKELNKQIEGIGCIVVFNKEKTDPLKLMKEWTAFFMAENCDKCTPCREGMYRIDEMVNSGKLDKKTLNDMFFVLEKTSFCPLGRNAFKPFKTLVKKLM